ncbi:MFS transporter [Xanthomonas citri pv. citri]|nr:MFS transporter [Xanthomonas citri pv. citri]MBD3983505.1 MFS transporter [Xanthomonas citri pv. citri]MBD3988662.1 MFS transporter [Xanthomonas citri pv. citri]MBD4012399.1 MFS transporter [Xanthomonas citri pv. citri]MBD4019916.1 MFS transporter [Xanthomonas citri pv. citri]
MAAATIIYWTGGDGRRILAFPRRTCTAVSSSDHRSGSLPDPSTRSDTGVDAPAGVRIRVALFLAGFATFSLLYSVQPVLPEFARAFKVDAATASLPLSLATGALALAIFCAGAVSENLGRRGLMFVSIAIAAVLNLIAAFLPHWGALVVVRTLSGIALGGVPAVAMVYLGEELPASKMGAATGLYVAGNAFGGMSGRIVMSVLTDHTDWRTALAVLSAFDLLCALAFFWLLPPSRNFVRRHGINLRFHLRAWAGHLRDRNLPFLFALPFLLMGVFVCLYNYAGFRLGGPEFGLSQSQIGMIFSAHVFGIVSSSVAGAASDRFGRGPVVTTGIVLCVLGVALTLAHALALVVAGIVVVTIGFFIAHSAASAWVSRLGGAHRSHAASLYLLAYYAGSSVIGALGGWFWQHGGWGALVGMCLTLLAIAFAAAYVLRQRADDARPYGRFAPHPARGE